MTTERKRAARQAIFRFVFAFLCVFGGLTLPSPGFGPSYARLHTAIGNALVRDHAFQSGARLHFEATNAELVEKPWQTMLVISPPGHRSPARVDVDLRALGYLPTAAFIALVAATPVRTLRRSLGVLGIGLVVLEPLLLLLIGLPLLSFLGGQGPIQVFELGRAWHVIVNIVYRALVAPLGMAFAVPLLLYWGLLRIPVERFGTGPLFTKFHSKRPRDVTSLPTNPS